MAGPQPLLCDRGTGHAPGDHRLRAHSGTRRSAAAATVALADREVAVQAQAEELLALNELLERLEAENPRLLKVVECRFFAGYSETETAEALGVSTRTVERDWLRARVWLKRAMTGSTAATNRPPGSPRRARRRPNAVAGDGRVTDQPHRDPDRLLEEALQLPPDARQAFLDTHCGDDRQSRLVIEELLRESDELDPVLKARRRLRRPVVGRPARRAGRPDDRRAPRPLRSPRSASAPAAWVRSTARTMPASARDVAIKVLPATSGGADALARFEREARAVAALNHPNILAIHDVGAEGSVHFVVTELLEGETLRARLAARGSLAPAEAVSYGVQIARGLAAAHDRGIVHRDLKPDNIFVTRDGRIKILDFGIAIFDQAAVPTGEQSPLTRTGLAMGTVGYMSPEQLLGQPATAQSDLFAFGVVMHEMLAGSHPFARRTAPEVQTAVLREDPASLSRAVPGVSPSLVRVIERCLDKQPAQPAGVGARSRDVSRGARRGAGAGSPGAAARR